MSSHPSPSGVPDPELPLAPTDGVPAVSSSAHASVTGPDDNAIRSDVPESASLTEFLEEPATELRPPQRSRKPGPGLIEAVAWTLGVFFAHLAASVAIMVLIVGLIMVTQQEFKLEDLSQLPPQYMLLLIGGDQLLVLLAVIIATGIRFSGRVRRTLNLSLPHPLHVLAVIGMILPLSILSGEVYRLTQMGWEQLAELAPMLRQLDGLNTVEVLPEIVKSVPLPLMLLIIAVCPALGEELVFRGVIGRGLVARWGMVAGVAITSVLFGMMHLHPVHAVAVIPLGIAMHLIYLATRSFWAPVLLHFLNNSWATLATRWSTESPELAAMDHGGAAPAFLWAALVAVIVLGALIYSTRIRYLLADGSEWSPGYLSVELPPAGVAYNRTCGMVSNRTLVTALSAWLSFAAAFACELTAFAR